MGSTFPVPVPTSALEPTGQVGGTEDLISWEAEPE